MLARIENIKLGEFLPLQFRQDFPLSEPSFWVLSNPHRRLCRDTRDGCSRRSWRPMQSGETTIWNGGRRVAIIEPIAYPHTQSLAARERPFSQVPAFENWITDEVGAYMKMLQSDIDHPSPYRLAG